MDSTTMMHYIKPYLFLLLGAILLSNCGRGQSVSDDEVVETLKEFYINYNTVWSEAPSSIQINVLHARLDSLLSYYCTPNLMDSVRKYREFGQDYITNDLGSVEMNKNLQVVKDANRDNVYLVTFDAYNGDASGRLIKQHVILKVHVVKEGGFFKIDAVE